MAPRPALSLFDAPVAPAPLEMPHTKLTAAQVCQALRGRHPSGPPPMPGQWTCAEELWGIDFLAWSAWKEKRRVGYEIKVSRSDYRRELLKPDKRAPAKQRLHQMYMAVPAGMLTPAEVAFKEPIWEDGAFARQSCPDGCVSAARRGRGVHDRYMPRQGTVARDHVPVPIVVREPPYSVVAMYRDDRNVARHELRRARRRPYRGEEGPPPEPEITEADIDEFIAAAAELEVERSVRSHGWTSRTCPTCGGKGYVKGARVEDADIPTLWVPADLGLVEVHLGPRGGLSVKEVKRAPILTPRRLSDSEMAEAFRWISCRPDPRHHPRTNGYVEALRELAGSRHDDVAQRADRALHGR